jgi:hypothetical protein
MNERTSKLLGISDDQTVCDCCGKRNLKRTAVIELADGSIVHYGRDCAARELGKKFVVNVDSLVEIKKYISKWESKYTAEVIASAICNKMGYTAKVVDGKYHIQGVGVI